MFLLSETELVSSIPLKSISRIEILFYTSRNESLNLFNLDINFDENLIPLITSILECKPNLIHRKIYHGLDSDYIIEYNSHNRVNQLGQWQGTSFHMDIDVFNKNTNSSHKKTYWQSHKLHYSNVYPKSRELVKIYSRETNSGDARKIFNPQDSFGCREETVIYWSIPGTSTNTGTSNAYNSKFELCILSDKEQTQQKHPIKSIWRLVIDVIEDNHFIDSKMDAVNTWLEKIHKIKSTITLANQ